MPKRPSSDDAAKVLRRHGLVLVNQKGSHAKYRRTAHQPGPSSCRWDAKDLRVGTFHSIMEQARLTEDDF